MQPLHRKHRVSLKARRVVQDVNPDDFQAGLSTKALLVRFPTCPDSAPAIASPALLRPPPVFVRCHESKGLSALRVRGKRDAVVGYVSIAPPDVSSTSSSGVEMAGDASTPFFPLDFLPACVGGGVRCCSKCSCTGVVALSLIEPDNSTCDISISVSASSSTSSGPCWRSRICSSDGKSKRGLMALRVRGRCAAAPAECLSRRCSSVPLRSDAAEGAPSCPALSANLRKIFFPRLSLMLALCLRQGNV